MGLEKSEQGLPDIDVEELTRRYAEERLKRLRVEGIEQYHHDGKGSGDLDIDPHADAPVARAPIVEDLDVLIIGGGYAGLLAATKLAKAGIQSFRILEKGADFGGTWYWNRYPGAACDIESYIYMPLLEDLGYMPTQRYAQGPEILDHCRMIGRHFGLYDSALFQTAAQTLSWDENRSRWKAITSRGDMLSARFVISCTGLMSSPKLPGIPGIGSFAGRMFHTSRWDYRYTGGDPMGNMIGLQDKTVGIIGTGSTGIQCIPHLGEWAEQLYVFQRTPSSVSVRDNRATDTKWAGSLKPGWQRERVVNFTNITSGIPQAVDLVDDGWTDLMKSIPFTSDQQPSESHAEALLLADLRKMEAIRQRIDHTVKDRATAEALKPYYKFMCKRPGFHDRYLDAFNRPNVTLVDTAGKGVDRVTPAGAIVDGKEYRLDCLIFATGFDFMTGYVRESGLQVEGRDGRLLSEHWGEGARTLFGMQTAGFPNFFLISLVQSGNSSNYMHTAGEQTDHIVHLVDQCLRREIAAIEPTPEAEDEWVEAVLSAGELRRAWLEACTPSYFNFEGKHSRTTALNDIYGGGLMPYVTMLEQWRTSGDMKGMTIKYAPSSAKSAVG